MYANITEEHLNLVSRIYDLPLNPDGWSSVLDDFASMLNASFAGTTVHDPVYAHQLNAITSNFSPSLMQEYFNNLPADYQSPFAKMAENPKRGFLTDLEMNLIDSYEEYGERPMVKWLKKNHNLYHSAASCLNVDGAWNDILIVMFSSDRGPINDEEKQLGNFFLDHFAKATELCRRFGVLKYRFNGALTALDRFHMGIFILSANGTIKIKNAEANRLIDENDGINISPDKKLYLTDPDKRAELSSAISKAINTAHAQDDYAESHLTILCRACGDSYLVEVTPIRDKHKIGNKFSGCIVFIIDPNKTDVVSTEGMKALYRLTNSESEVCKLVAEGFETNDIAEARNLTRETVRSYVKQVLHKTGTKNRSQLVRLALSVNLPIDSASN